MLLLTLTAACTQAPQLLWPPGPVPRAPALLPADELAAPPGATNLGPALQARANGLRAALGL
jgi:hypothetical protein